jgi:hypothetical protein
VLNEFFQSLPLKSEVNAIPIALAHLPVMQTYSNFYRNNDCINLSSNMFGYFQSKDLNHEVYFPKPILPDIKSFAPVIMHFRAGDMNNKTYAMNYYRHALSEINEKKVEVVTSTFDEFKEIALDFPKIEFLHKPDLLANDFAKLVNAKYLIGAPSTLSWWAAKFRKDNNFQLPKATIDTLGYPH